MLTEADIQLHADKIRDDGYTVIERAADPALVEGLKAALERTEREHGFGYAKTSFEGFKTVRINNLLTYDEMFWEVPLHENVLPIVERVLDKECLLSSFCSLVLGPGQEAQPIHEDTQLIPLPRPHIPIMLNAIWALSDFTQENGATRIVPGSHKYASLAGIRQGLRRRHRDHAGRQRDAVRQRALAWRRRQHQRCQALCVFLRLLLGLDAAAGKPAARDSASRRRGGFRGGCRNCAATASTRDSSATSTTAIRSNCWAASAASAWCGKRPTSGRRGWRSDEA